VVKVKCFKVKYRPAAILFNVNALICFNVKLHLKLINDKIYSSIIVNSRMGEERGCIRSCWGNRREEDHWGDLSLDGWIILRWISRRWDVGIWTGLGWPRIETGGGRL